jgi:hypothetical protein
MKESFKIWFKAIPEGWKLFGAIVGFAAIVWGGAIKFDHWRNKGIADHALITYLSKADTLRKKELKEFKEAIVIRLDFISDSLSLAITGNKSITNSFATYVKTKSSTVDEFLNAVNGLEFTLVQPVGAVNKYNKETPEPSAIIRMQKKKP